jgi:hypothetical protein
VVYVNSADPYPALTTYGVKFYGDEPFFDQAGYCEIQRYNKNIRCYCVNSAGTCSDYSRSRINQCSDIVSSSYRETIEVRYLIAIICVFFLFFYIVLDICYIRNHANEFQAASVVEASVGIPTTATYVKPSIVIVDSPDSVAILTQDQNDGNYDHNSYFGSIELVATPATDERPNSNISEAEIQHV